MRKWANDECIIWAGGTGGNLGRLVGEGRGGGGCGQECNRDLVPGRTSGLL